MKPQYAQDSGGTETYGRTRGDSAGQKTGGSEYQTSGLADSNIPGGGDSGGMGVYSPQPAQQQAATATAAAATQTLPEYSYDLNGVNPQTDFGYASFLSGYGLDKSSAQAQAAYRRQSLNAQLNGALPGFETERKDGILNATENSGQRGAIRSSSNLLSQDRAVNAVNTKEAALRSGIADQQAQVAFGLQDTLNQLERSRASAEIEARQTILQQQNQQIAMQRALAQYGLDPETVIY